MYGWVRMDVGYFLSSLRNFFWRKKWHAKRQKQRKINISNETKCATRDAIWCQRREPRHGKDIRFPKLCKALCEPSLAVKPIWTSCASRLHMPCQARCLRFEIESRPRAVHCFSFYFHAYMNYLIQLINPINISAIPT